MGNEALPKLVEEGSLTKLGFPSKNTPTRIVNNVNPTMNE